MAVKRIRQNVAYSPDQPLLPVAPLVIVALRDPKVQDLAEVGTTWINEVSNAVFILTSIIGGLATWTTSPASGSGTFTAVTVNPGNLTVTAGNISVPLGNLSLAAGNATIGGNLTVTGTSTFNGPVVFSATGSFQVTTTDNIANAILLEANGGTSETISILAAQGTGAASVSVASTSGGVQVLAGLASATALTLQANNAAGGVALLSGTGGIAVTAANGPVAIASGTGAMNISNDAAATTVNLGTGAAVKLVTLGSVTGISATTVRSGTGALNVTSTGGALTINSGVGALGISTDASATAVSIGTGAAVVKTIAIGGTGANVITIGNTQTAGSFSVGAAMTTGTVSIGGTGLQTGNFDLAPGTGAQAVTLANGAGIKTLNIGNGTSGNTISIGNGANTVAQVINIASGAAGAASTVNILNGVATAGVQTLNLAAGASVKAINIGTGAAANVVTLGSVTGAANTVIQAGTLGIDLNAAGIVSMQAATDTQASPSATSILNVFVGSVTFTGFTTAAAASQVFTFTNNKVTATSQILCSASTLGANDAQMTVTRILPAAGTFNVTLKNNGAAAVNGNIIITWWVLA